jgi:hypothetical protein
MNAAGTAPGRVPGLDSPVIGTDHVAIRANIFTCICMRGGSVYLISKF